MSERRWGLFGRKTETPPPQMNLFVGQEIPVLDMDSEKTALTSKYRRPSLEQLTEEQTTQLLAEKAQEDALAAKLDEETQRAIQGSKNLDKLRDGIHTLVLPYESLIWRRTSELHAAADSRPIGGKKFEVYDYSLNENGEREYAFNITYHTEKDKEGGKHFVPDSYTQSLVQGEELNEDSLRLSINFENGQMSNIAFVPRKGMLDWWDKNFSERYDYIYNNKKRPLLGKIIKDLNFTVQAFSLELQSVSAKTSHKTNEYSDGWGRWEYYLNRVIPRYEKTITFSPDENKFVFVEKNYPVIKPRVAERSTSLSIDNTQHYLNLLQEMLSFIPAKRLNA